LGAFDDAAGSESCPAIWLGVGLVERLTPAVDAFEVLHEHEAMQAGVEPIRSIAEATHRPSRQA